MCRARKTSVISARFRCRAGVRNRGQPELWNRSEESTPSTTTALSRIIETAPAPLVVYQRSVSFTAGGLGAGGGGEAPGRGGVHRSRRRPERARRGARRQARGGWAPGRGG